MAPWGIESALATPDGGRAFDWSGVTEIPWAPFSSYTAPVISTSRMTPEGR